MSSEFLIATSLQESVLDAIERASQDRLGLVCNRRPGVLIGTRDLSIQPLPHDRGVVLGEIFRADTKARGLVDFSSDSAEGFATAFVKSQWGDYVAVTPTRTGGVEILRSPSGSLAAYWARTADGAVVASDVGLLIDAGLLGAKIDWAFVSHFLAYPFLRARRTGFKDLAELLPGSTLSIVPGGGVSEREVWSPWTHVEQRHPRRSLPELLRQQTEGCVQAWADGQQDLILELSGGLDSSILAACLAKVPARVTAVNMVSPARDGDERIFARAAAEAAGLPLREIELSPTSASLTAAPKARRPRPGGHGLLSGWDAALAQLAQDTGADAFMSGGGGDNVFFNSHGTGPAADALRSGRPGDWLNAAGDLSRLHHCSVWQAGAMSIKRALGAPRWAWRSDFRYLSQAARATGPEHHPWLEPRTGVLSGKVDHVKALMAVQNYVDAFSRAEQAPIIMPLLSQPIIELCLSIPGWEWIRGGQDRAVARRAFSGQLPLLVLERRSKGNLAGFAGPAFEQARAELRDHLIGGQLVAAGLLDVAAIEADLSAPGPPRNSDFFRIMQIADVESWARRWA